MADTEAHMYAWLKYCIATILWWTTVLWMRPRIRLLRRWAGDHELGSKAPPYDMLKAALISRADLLSQRFEIIKSSYISRESSISDIQLYIDELEEWNEVAKAWQLVNFITRLELEYKLRR